MMACRYCPSQHSSLETGTSCSICYHAMPATVKAARRRRRARGRRMWRRVA